MSNESIACVKNDQLLLGPVKVTFQRTLRIPEVGRHDLPPGLGCFPLRRVSDYPDTAPPEWLARSGVLLPIYQREAMWLSFESREPTAVQVGAGKVCAISGEAWRAGLDAGGTQNHVPLPDQSWLDGINAGRGFIRQFVAVPLGHGATIEAQVTGDEVSGGVQLRAVGLTAQARAVWEREPRVPDLPCCASPAAASDAAMGLGAGGRMRQEIYTDQRPTSDYDESRSWQVFVHLCSAAQWTAITGEVPPPTPIGREAYVRHRLPWFDYYDADRDDLAASEALGRVRSVGQVLGETEPPFTPVEPFTTIQLKDSRGGTIEAGRW